MRFSMYIHLILLSFMLSSVASYAMEEIEVPQSFDPVDVYQKDYEHFTSLPKKTRGTIAEQYHHKRRDYLLKIAVYRRRNAEHVQQGE